MTDAYSCYRCGHLCRGPPLHHTEDAWGDRVGICNDCHRHEVDELFDAGEDEPEADGQIVVVAGEIVLVAEVILFRVSPDYDQPDCICSFCKLDFHKEEDDTGQPDLPIRMFINEGHGGEARFHITCFEQLFTITEAKISVRPGVRLVFIEPAFDYQIGPACPDCLHSSCMDIRFYGQTDLTGDVVGAAKIHSWPSPDDLFRSDLIP